jgi:hypothetical protein
MGSAVSAAFSSTAPEFKIWSKEEAIENENSHKNQKRASDYIIANMYINIPVKISKKSSDPKSPLWIEVKHEIVEMVTKGQESYIEEGFDPIDEVSLLNMIYI